MTEFRFEPAVKEQEKARIALEGPSGSGKTWTALSMAQGLGQRIALIDTEKRSARKYGADFSFQTLALHSFDPRDLPKALSAAAAAEFDVVIVDSLSHFWMGKGGMLEQVDSFARRNTGGNSWAAWKDANPLEQQMIDGLLSYPGHVIVTMRTKTEWVITENDKGRKEPKKIGLKAQQREGIEYEFDIVGDLDLDHNLVVTKTRMSALADQVIARPDAELGARILEWLNDGTALPTVSEYLERLGAATSVQQVRALYTEVHERGMGAAPCMQQGQPTTLRNIIVQFGNLMQADTAPAEAPAPPAAEVPPAAPVPPTVREPKPHQKKRAQRSTKPQASEWDTPAPAPVDDVEIVYASTEQLTALHARLAQKHGPMTDEQRFAGMAAFCKRPISSASQLTVDEFEALMETLKGATDYTPPRRRPSEDEQDAAAQREAEALAATDEPDAERVESDLRDQIEAADTGDELNATMDRAFQARKAGVISPAQHTTLMEAQKAKRRAWAAAAEIERQRLAQLEPVGAAA